MNKKFMYFILVCLALAATVSAQVNGKVYLTGQTDHSGVKVKFIAQSLTAETDSAYTTANGDYAKTLKNGIYSIHFSKTGYHSASYKFGQEVLVSSPVVLASHNLFSEKYKFKEGVIKGRLSRDTTYIFSDVLIENSTTLEVEGGTRIYVMRGKKIQVYGNLILHGSINDTISICSYDELLGESPVMNWEGIYFNYARDGMGTPVKKMEPFRFNFVKIKNANYALNFPGDPYADYGAKVVIENSEIKNCIIVSNANTTISNSLIRDCIRIHSGSRALILHCNNIRLPDVKEDPNSYASNIGIGLGFAGKTSVTSNLINVNFNITRISTFCSAQIDTEFVFRDNLIINNIGIIELDFSFKDQTKSSLQEISGNTFDGGHVNLFAYANEADQSFRVFNNIFNCYVHLDSIHNNAFRFSMDHNLFKKVDGKSKYTGLGVILAENQNGDPIDTYYNLFQSPRFINNKPPYLSAGSPAVNAGVDGNNQPVNLGINIMGSCLEPLFVKETEQPFSDTLSISGLVHQGNGFMTNGIVMAINTSTGIARITKVSSTGSFTVDSLVKGPYVLYAVPNPVTVTDYSATYYVNKRQLSEAVTLNLKGKIRETNIYLLPVTKEKGFAGIQGRFSYDDQNTDDTSSFSRNWFGDYSARQNFIAIENEPCKNMPVLLYNSRNEVIGATVTDREGYYNFPNLVGGNYKVTGERAGYHTEDGGFLRLSADSKAIVRFKMLKNTVTGVDDGSEDPLSSEISAYPNPFQDRLNMKGYTGSYQVTDVTGSIMLNGNGNHTVTTVHWPAGVYFLKAGNKVQKLVKQ